MTIDTNLLVKHSEKKGVLPTFKQIVSFHNRYNSIMEKMTIKQYSTKPAFLIRHDIENQNNGEYKICTTYDGYEDDGLELEYNHSEHQ